MGGLFQSLGLPSLAFSVTTEAFLWVTSTSCVATIQPLESRSVSRFVNMARSLLSSISSSGMKLFSSFALGFMERRTDFSGAVELIVVLLVLLNLEPFVERALLAPIVDCIFGQNLAINSR